MLPKSHRLSRLEFNQVRKSGHKINNYPYLLTHSPSQSLKVSVVISKKILKKAVLRNRYRRFIYDYLYPQYQNLQQNIIIYPLKHEVDFSFLDQVLSNLVKL